MFGLLRIVRGIFGVIGAWQLLGLLPAFTWLASWLQGTLSVTGEMLAYLFMKLVLAAICIGLFLWLRVLINKLYEKTHKSPHPALIKRWAL